jgi:hypothetical protein
MKNNFFFLKKKNAISNVILFTRLKFLTCHRDTLEINSFFFYLQLPPLFLSFVFLFLLVFFSHPAQTLSISLALSSFSSPLPLHRFLSHSLSPPLSGLSLSLRTSVCSKAMDASSRNRWSYDSLKNLGQISPAVQIHLKQVLIVSSSLFSVFYCFLWFCVLGRPCLWVSLVTMCLDLSRI